MKNLMRRLNRPVALGCAVIFPLAAMRILWIAVAQKGDMLLTAFFVILLLVLAFGLLRQSRWAMRTAAAVFLLSAIVLPIGLFNPFTAGDDLLAGRQPPSVVITLLWLIPLDALLLAVAYVLDSKDAIRK